jgi:hypothetical protein
LPCPNGLQHCSIHRIGWAYGIHAVSVSKAVGLADRDGRFVLGIADGKFGFSIDESQSNSFHFSDLGWDVESPRDGGGEFVA